METVFNNLIPEYLYVSQFKLKKIIRSSSIFLSDNLSPGFNSASEKKKHTTTTGTSFLEF